MNSNSFKDKVKLLNDILAQEVIDLEQLRSVCMSGIPDYGDSREVCWKILLNYLPLNRSKWNQALREKRQLYRDYMNEFIVQPGRKHGNSVVAQQVEMNGDMGLGEEDHPLSCASNSEWQQYFTDNSELLQQIDKDCRRLFPDYAFFQKPTEFPATVPTTDESCPTSPVEESSCLGKVAPKCSGGVVPKGSYLTLRKRVELSVLEAINVSHDRYGIVTKSSPEQVAKSYTLGDGDETHWEVIERVLFIYAKLNKTTGYVQGMNELIGPIYHVFATSPNKGSREFAEADSFFCFVSLMAENRDIYTKTMDNSVDGIQGKFQQLNHVLKTVDWDLFLSLQKQRIHPQFYAFRWLSLLFTQEFHLPDIERLWDTLFADADRFFYSIIVAVAMLTLERPTILQANFNDSMYTLQHYNHTLDLTLQQASLVYDKYMTVTKPKVSSFNGGSLEKDSSATVPWINRKLQSVKGSLSSSH